MQPDNQTASAAKPWGLFDSVLDRIAWVCKILTGSALVFLTVIFGWLVYGRYVLNDTPTWVEQASLLLMMLICFLGAAVGIHENTHLSVAYFRDIAPRWLRTLFVAVTDAMLGIFGVLMAVYGYELTVFKWGSQIPLIGLPEGLRSLPITVCGVLICLFSLGHLIRLLRGVDARGNPTE